MVDSKKLYITDASVMIKWISKDEENMKEALKLKEDFELNKIELATTTLCYHEILNYLGLNKPKIALNFFSKVLTFQITEYLLTLGIANRAINIMQKFPKISFYDASYHATAIENNGTFLTADSQYYKKAKKLRHIKLLKDYR